MLPRTADVRCGLPSTPLKREGSETWSQIAGKTVRSFSHSMILIRNWLAYVARLTVPVRLRFWVSPRSGGIEYREGLLLSRQPNPNLAKP